MKGVIRWRLIIVIDFLVIVVDKFVVICVGVALEMVVVGGKVVLIVKMTHVQLTVLLCEWVVVFFLQIQVGEMRSDLLRLPAARQCFLLGKSSFFVTGKGRLVRLR